MGIDLAPISEEGWMSGGSVRRVGFEKKGEFLVIVIKMKVTYLDVSALDDYQKHTHCDGGVDSIM